jgi:hypothetical protein
MSKKRQLALVLVADLIVVIIGAWIGYKAHNHQPTPLSSPAPKAHEG